MGQGAARRPHGGRVRRLSGGQGQSARRAGDPRSFGLSDWAQLAADEFAAAGYIAIAPDLLSGKGPAGGTKTMDSTAIGQAIRDLPADQITAT